MSWETPFTAVAGSVYTAAQANQIRDNLLALRGLPDLRCEIYNSGTQEVTSGNANVLTMDSEVYDTGSMHSTSSDTSRITIPTGGGGVYLVHGQTLAVNSGSASAAPKLHIYVSGNLVRTTRWANPGNTLSGFPLSLTAVFSLSAGEYVELAGEAVSANVTFGSSAAAEASRLTVVGPWPPSS